MLFTMDRFLLSLDLRSYAEIPECAHKDQAKSLAMAIDSVSSPDNLDELLKAEGEIIQSLNRHSLFARNPAQNEDINAIKDRFEVINEEHTETITTGSCDCASAHCSCQDEASEKAFKKR